MLDFEPQFPRISLAVRLISADAENRQAQRMNAAERGRMIERRIRAGAAPLTPFELEEVETFLAGLSREDLETLCVEDHALARAIDAPRFVQEFLDRAFEGSADA